MRHPVLSDLFMRLMLNLHSKIGAKLVLCHVHACEDLVTALVVVLIFYPGETLYVPKCSTCSNLVPFHLLSSVIPIFWQILMV